MTRYIFSLFALMLAWSVPVHAQTSQFIGPFGPTNPIVVGNLILEDTTTATSGVVMKGTIRFLHNYHNPTGNGFVPEGHNVFVGELAGNFTMGATAALGAYESSNNTAIGYRSFINNTKGYRNTAIGFQSLHDNSLGHSNTGVGPLSLYANATGFDNIGIGYQSGRYIANGSTANTAGSMSVFIGDSTRALAGSQENQVVIGHGAIGMGSNTVRLGALATITDTYLTGAVHSRPSVEAVTTTKTPSLDECGETYTNTGDGDGTAFTLLNDPVIGCTYRFIATAAQTMTITANTGETLEVAGDTCVLSISITDGMSVTLEAATAGSGAQWHVVASEGVFGCNDA